MCGSVRAMLLWLKGNVWKCEGNGDMAGGGLGSLLAGCADGFCA
jgi:hypothetical protein